MKLKKLLFTALLICLCASCCAQEDEITNAYCSSATMNYYNCYSVELNKTNDKYKISCELNLYGDVEINLNNKPVDSALIERFTRVVNAAEIPKDKISLFHASDEPVYKTSVNFIDKAQIKSNRKIQSIHEFMVYMAVKTENVKKVYEINVPYEPQEDCYWTYSLSNYDSMDLLCKYTEPDPNNKDKAIAGFVFKAYEMGECEVQLQYMSLSDPSAPVLSYTKNLTADKSLTITENAQ